MLDTSAAAHVPATTGPVTPAGAAVRSGLGAFAHVIACSLHAPATGRSAPPARLLLPAQHRNTALVTVSPAGTETANRK